MVFWCGLLRHSRNSDCHLLRLRAESQRRMGQGSRAAAHDRNSSSHRRISHCTFKYTPASGRLANYPSAPCDGGASQLARTYPPGSFEVIRRHPVAQVEFRTQTGALNLVDVKPAVLGIRPDAQAGELIALAYNARNPNIVEKPAAKGVSRLWNQLFLIAALAICTLVAIRFIWRLGFG